MAKKNGGKNSTTPVIDKTEDPKLPDQKEQKNMDTTIEQKQDQATSEGSRTVITAERVYNLSTDEIESAIAEGFIRWGGGTPDAAGTRKSAITDVTISKDKSPTKKAETQPYEKLEALTWEGMVLLSGGKAEAAVLRGEEKVDPRNASEKAKGAPDHFNYGIDLEVKRGIRKDLESEIAGPEKAIAGMAKNLLTLKVAPNMDAALAMARKFYEEQMAQQAEAEGEESERDEDQE